MGDGNKNTQPQAENKSSLTNVVVLVLGSLGLLGGGGGAYLVNDNVSTLQQEMQTTLAVVQTNMTHVTETVEKLSQQVIDLNDGFQQEFKDHLGDPNLHAQGMSKLRESLEDEMDEKDKTLEERLRDPMKKQWEILGELRDRVTTLEAWKNSVEAQ